MEIVHDKSLSKGFVFLQPFDLVLLAKFGTMCLQLDFEEWWDIEIVVFWSGCPQLPEHLYHSVERC